MKLNGKFIKVALAFIVIAGVSFWAFGMLGSRSYDGTDLNFAVEAGPITINNTSDQPVPVHLTGTGSRTFRVTSSVEGVAGSSATETDGGVRSQLLAFELPAGKSEFTVSGGSDVLFVSDSDTRMDATVRSVTDDTRNTTLIGAGIVILVALIYASHATGHAWLNIVRPNPIRTEMPAAHDSILTPKADDKSGQGRAAKSYGDNRS